eukprot:764751-Hanusia_phi.AAC.2
MQKEAPRPREAPRSPAEGCGRAPCFLPFSLHLYGRETSGEDQAELRHECVEEEVDDSAQAAEGRRSVDGRKEHATFLLRGLQRIAG